MTSLSHVSGETIEVKLHVVSHSPKMMTPKVSLVKTRRIMINEAEHKDNMKIYSHKCMSLCYYGDE